jgi:hypothetical protein
MCAVRVATAESPRFVAKQRHGFVGEPRSTSPIDCEKEGVSYMSVPAPELRDHLTEVHGWIGCERGKRTRQAGKARLFAVGVLALDQSWPDRVALRR